MRQLVGCFAFMMFVLLAASGAEAGSSVTFISGTGANTGGCTQAAPCRTMLYALSQTNARGEVRALNSAYYGNAVISRSVRLIGVPGATLGRTTSGDVVQIAATAGSVDITGFIIEGGYAAQTGIYGIVSAAPDLTVKNCIIRNLPGDGIIINASVNGNALIEDTVIERIGNYGIYLNNSVNALDAVLNRVTITQAKSTAVEIGKNSHARIANSMFAQGTTGIYLGTASSFLTLQSTAIVGNLGWGIVPYGDKTAYSAGNNSLITNGGGKVAGTLNKLGQD